MASGIAQGNMRTTTAMLMRKASMLWSVKTYFMLMFRAHGDHSHAFFLSWLLIKCWFSMDRVLNPG